MKEGFRSKHKFAEDRKQKKNKITMTMNLEDRKQNQGQRLIISPQKTVDYILKRKINLPNSKEHCQDSMNINGMENARNICRLSADEFNGGNNTQK